MLVQRHGQIVPKDELIRLVWPDAFVEESNISQNIFLLRKALGKDEEGRQFIETVPRRGYRFIAKVREEREQGVDVEAAEKRPGPDRTSSKEAQTTDLADRYTCSIAVLPLTNLSADPDVEYLCDGITEVIINRLSQLPYLRVIARPTVFRFKGQEIRVQEVARKLNVEHVATGRILARGDDLNIQVDLTDAIYESQFWGKQYDSKLTDILEVQGKIAQDVLEQLKVQCTSEEQERVTRRHTNNVEVYQLYLKGYYHQNQFTEEGLKKGVECFQQAIDKEPNFALAYTGLAECYALGGLSLDPQANLGYPDFIDNDTTSGPNEAMTKAKAAAMMALKLDDTLAEAHAALGFIRYRFDWDWETAESEYRRAIELSPNYAKAHYWLSICLRTMGRLDEALAEVKLAHELDPLMLIITVELGRTFYFARLYDLAIKYYREVIDLEPNFLPAHFRLGQAYVQKGMYEEAVEEFQLAIPPTGNDPDVMAALAFVYAISGRTDEARDVLNQLKALSRERHVSSYSLALVYVGLDDKDEALKWLRTAYDDRSVWLIGIKVEPMLDHLRPDPRFTELVQRVGVAG